MRVRVDMSVGLGSGHACACQALSEHPLSTSCDDPSPEYKGASKPAVLQVVLLDRICYDCAGQQLLLRSTNYLIGDMRVVLGRRRNFPCFLCI
jgi:hypothetical protein